MKQYPLIYKGKIISEGRSIHPTVYALISIVHGMYYKYPLCCIKQFTIETLNSEPSGYKRNLHFDCSETNGTGYVPCDKCLKGKEL